MSENEQKQIPARIQTFDILRGLCIMIMVVTHGLFFWIKPSEIWFFALEGATVGSLGASGFVFVSGVSFGFSWAKHRDPATKKDQYLKSVSHSLVLFIVGIIFNIIWGLAFGIGGWMDIFAWQILQCLAISRLIALLFSSINIKGKMILSLGIIALSSTLLNMIGFNHPAGILESIIFDLFFNPLDAYPLLVYLPIFLLGSVIGEEIMDLSRNQVECKTFFKRWLVIGCLFLVIGVVLGWQWEGGTIYMGRPGMDWLHTNPALWGSWYPLLFDLNSYAWCLFYSGILILLLLSLFYFIDMNPARKTNTPLAKKSLFSLFGTYSLTIYIGHLTAFLLLFELDYVTVWVPVVGLLFLIYLVIWQLDKVGKGKFCLEFVMGILGVMVYRKLRKRKIPGGQARL